ncbi:hypothetical protein [uncultured Eubacterium sp.]|uniref:hypothetical protein n=1 Tax=uncultured Eubacterium sp. TaxID=165185 RepID=UPI002594C894|nr:hypothetical protein [uncultured Eubacterium sp.]
MKLKDLKEKLKNKIQESKTKQFVEEHKSDVLLTAGITTVVTIGLTMVFKRALYVHGMDCFMAGARMSSLADVSAMDKVIGPEQTELVMKEATEITKKMCENFNQAKLTPHQFNRMYEAIGQDKVIPVRK